MGTNKPYFYPGETSWLGGRMLYQEPTLGDSLSRVVYVDLIDSTSTIIQSATFPIRHSKISGGLEVPPGLEPGDYILRAYTHWNLNFPEQDQFITPFVVLNPGYEPKADIPDTEDYFGEIQVNTSFTLSDSLSYRVMNLNIELLDGFQNPIDGEFILSITDAGSVQDLPEENRLEKAMNWLDNTLPTDFKSDLSFPVEYGISVQGKFVPANKRQSLINPITIVRGGLEDYGQVTTDSAGRFRATGLYFTDTTQIAIAAVYSKLRPFGSVELNPLTKPAALSQFPKIRYQKIPVSSTDNLLDGAGDYILLEEFVKEVQKDVTNESNWYGFGEPDRIMSVDQLSMSLDMMTVLMRIGFNSSSSKIVNYNYGVRTGAPLLIIDGAKYPFLENQEFVEMIKSYVPQELKSVGVYTFGSVVFGMAGYSGVVVLETKRGQRFIPGGDRKFNSEGFQIFDLSGFTNFLEFPKNPPSDQYLKKKPTIYWEPDAQSVNGVLKVQVKIPYGIRRLGISLEGVTIDGEAFYKKIDLSL